MGCRRTHRGRGPDGHSGRHRPGGGNGVDRGRMRRAMAKYLVEGTEADVQAIRNQGDHIDSRRAAWLAIKRGSEVIEEIQRKGRTRDWTTLSQAMSFINPPARTILAMRLEAIHSFKVAPHHRHGFRMNV